MNTMTEWLAQYFDEIEPKDFYREIFPEGSFESGGNMSGEVTTGFSFL